MTVAIKNQAPSNHTYYHCYGQCLSHGINENKSTKLTNSLSKNQHWLFTSLKKVTKLFSINILSYAIVGNDYHLIIELDSSTVKSISDKQVLTHWTALSLTPLVVQRHLAGDSLCNVEKLLVADRVKLYREQLADISWFMRFLSQQIAQLANSDNGANGRYWHTNHKFQSLLEPHQLVHSMIYVDLYPSLNSATISKSKQAYCTSLQQRQSLTPINSYLEIDNLNHTINLSIPYIFNNSPKQYNAYHIAYADYLNLVEWVYSLIAVKQNKRTTHQPNILKHLNTHHVLASLGYKPTGIWRLNNIINYFKKVTGNTNHQAFKHNTKVTQLFPDTYLKFSHFNL